jgi:hypothetical protein
MHTAQFATRNQNKSSTAIDNILVDNSRLNITSVSPTINTLSEHNVQVLTIKNIQIINNFLLNQKTKLMNNEQSRTSRVH